MIYLKKGTFYLEKKALWGCWIFFFFFFFFFGGGGASAPCPPVPLPLVQWGVIRG